jgi:exopolysaccharide production protein ExoZ
MNKTLYSVQILRALAASAVVAYHTIYMLAHMAGYSFVVPIFGGAGVDLFFVISGFVMVYTNHDAFRRPGASTDFLRRRILRIAPIYWLYTTLVVVLLALAPSLFSTTKFDWRHVISSYVFLLSANTAGNIGTVTQTGWTLCYEMYFYLLFSVFLLFPKRVFLPLAGGVFLLGIGIGASGVELPAWATVATKPMLLEFLLGAAIGFMFLAGLRLSRLAAAMAIVAALIAIGLSGNELSPWGRVVWWGLPNGAILLGALSFEGAGFKAPRPLVALGDSSYSLYLVHPFVIPVFGKLWAMFLLASAVSPIVLFVLAFGSSLLVGHVMYAAVERPITKWLTRNSPTLGPTSFREAPSSQAS